MLKKLSFFKLLLIRLGGIVNGCASLVVFFTMCILIDVLDLAMLVGGSCGVGCSVFGKDI